MSNIKTVTQVLASAVATSGTFTVTFPSGTTGAWFKAGTRHTITALGQTFSNPEDFGLTTIGGTTATVTWRHATTLPAGTTVRVGLDCPGVSSYRDVPSVFPTVSANIQPMFPVRVSLGAPATADADGIVDMPHIRL